ncbi:MAG: hypothetical protein LBQ22_02685 [Bacteroidales bacterium]|jgi:hypothetical protein|nr:hypothetical protein [Bacteroidales bacterium]
MKTFNKKFTLCIVTMIVIMLALGACKKNKDYRDKWIGTYECEKIHFEEQVVIVDVITEGDSFLKITERNIDEYTHGVKCDVKVNDDGIFEKIYDHNGIERPRIDGNFREDSLFIYYFDYSPNSTININYKGKKVKSK